MLIIRVSTAIKGGDRPPWLAAPFLSLSGDATMARPRLLDRLQYYLIPAIAVLLVFIALVAELFASTNTLIVPGGAIGAGFIILGFWYLLSDHEKRRF